MATQQLDNSSNENDIQYHPPLWLRANYIRDTVNTLTHFDSPSFNVTVWRILNILKLKAILVYRSMLINN